MTKNRDKIVKSWYLKKKKKLRHDIFAISPTPAVTLSFVYKTYTLVKL